MHIPGSGSATPKHKASKEHVHTSDYPALVWRDISYDIPLPRAQRKAAIAAANAGPAAGDEADSGAARSEPDVEKDGADGPKPAKVGTDVKPGMRRILNNIEGEVSSGEMVAILGASGAGKTTLLNILSARLDSTGSLAGQVLFRGVKRKVATWKRTLGFVEQDDLMYPQLSVKETLEYSASLRLPNSRYSVAEKRARAHETLDVLRLEKCRDTKIGDGEHRGVSGGERKRVSIGVELVSDVSVLMLDEPSSGLDAFAAGNVVSAIKDATRARKLATLMTIHQPSYNIFTTFDRVILLSRGSIFFSGPPRAALPYFESLGYPVPEGTNPADWYIMKADNNERTDEGERRVERLISEWKLRGPEIERQWRADRAAPAKQSMEGSEDEEAGAAIVRATTKEAKGEDERNATYPIGWFQELRILATRNLLQTSRDPAIWAASFGSNIVLLIIIGFAFFRLDLDQGGALGRIGVLLFIPTNTGFSVTFPVLAIFPLQRLIMVRERASGAYRTSSFFLAKMMTEVPSQILQRALFYLILYWMMGLRNSAGAYFIWLAANAIQIVATVALALAIGAGVTNIQVANIVAPLVNVLFLLFAGQLLPLRSIPKYFVWLHWLSPVTYAFAAVGQNELRPLTFSCDSSATSQCYPTGESMIAQYDIATFTIAENIGFIAALGFAFTFAGYVLLLRVGKPKWRVL